MEEHLTQSLEKSHCNCLNLKVDFCEDKHLILRPHVSYCQIIITVLCSGIKKYIFCHRYSYSKILSKVATVSK